jgi:hypothetical protein
MVHPLSLAEQAQIESNKVGLFGDCPAGRPLSPQGSLKLPFRSWLKICRHLEAEDSDRAILLPDSRGSLKPITVLTGSLRPECGRRLFKFFLTRLRLISALLFLCTADWQQLRMTWREGKVVNKVQALFGEPISYDILGV